MPAAFAIAMIWFTSSVVSMVMLFTSILEIASAAKYPDVVSDASPSLSSAPISSHVTSESSLPANDALFFVSASHSSCIASLDATNSAAFTTPFSSSIATVAFSVSAVKLSQMPLLSISEVASLSNASWQAVMLSGFFVTVSMKSS